MKELKSYELNLNVKKSDEDVKVELYIETINEITKLFYQKNLTLEDGLIVLDSLISAIYHHKANGFETIKETENI